jgi:putative phage-type endonuclease
MDMTLHVFPEIDQRSDEWYAQRRGMVTASAVSALLTPTLKPANNDTSRNLTASLVAERITGCTHETFINDDMWRGINEEPRARAKYAEHFGVEVAQVGFMVRAEKGWTLGYSPDGLVGDVGLIEIKAPRAKAHLQTILADEVPPQHMAQLQAGLLVSGRKWIDFVSWHGGMPMWHKRVHRQKQWMDAIRDACRAFEDNAAQMVAAYETATKGLPETEAAYDLEVVI